jgi:hypothetical protein
MEKIRETHGSKKCTPGKKEKEKKKQLTFMKDRKCKGCS